MSPSALPHGGAWRPERLDEAPVPDAVEGAARDALARGDPAAALEILMDAYGPALYRFCRRMVNDSGLADDVHQLTFVQAFESFGRFRGAATLRSWLFGIARHRCLDALKMAGRRRARFELVGDLPETEDPVDGPESDLEARSIRAVLEECLSRLPVEVRTALVLRFEDELTYPEMAGVCGEQPATLQARVARAMPKLKLCMEENGVTA